MDRPGPRPLTAGLPKNSVSVRSNEKPAGPDTRTGLVRTLIVISKKVHNDRILLDVDGSVGNVALVVDVEEIKRLGKRFKKLDLDGSGSLSVDEFMSLPELQQNPLVQRVIEIFDTDGNGEVDFKGW